jgi:hypothetical protein
MPIEITQSNNRVAEVTLTCDCCGKLIGNRLMPKAEAEDLKTKELFCGQCTKKKRC